MLVFIEHVGKGVYLIIRTQGIGFIRALLTKYSWRVFKEVFSKYYTVLSKQYQGITAQRPGKLLLLTEQ